MGPSPNILWIVATPIGNLDDLSARAKRTLAEADLIAAEDTRHSARLTAHLGIATPLISVHEHNEDRRIDALIERLVGGQSIALISDAGTPLVSDPGFGLVRAARAAGVEVRTVPGPCAAIAALSVAGLPSDRFVFEGFLPARASARRNRLAELADDPRTLIVYESSHRVVETAGDLAAVLGAERRLALCRELTKRHEQSVQCAAGELVDWLTGEANRRRGEFVLVIDGAHAAPAAVAEVTLDALLAELLALAGTKDAAAAAARLLGVSRNAAYTRALALR